MDSIVTIIRPIISEKSMQEAGKGKYTFQVSRNSNKKAIRFAVKELFEVTPVAVSTQIIKGRRKRIGKRRAEVSESIWKKATVELAKGQKIALFDTEEKKNE